MLLIYTVIFDNKYIYIYTYIRISKNMYIIYIYIYIYIYIHIIHMNNVYKGQYYKTIYL